MWFLSKQNNFLIYWSILIFTSFFLIWGNAFISISCFSLIGFWILEGDYKLKFKELISKKSPLFLIAIYAVIFLWAMFQLPHREAYRDIWENLPLLIFVLVIGSRSRLSQSQFHVVLLTYIFSIVINTVFNFTHFIITTDTNTDIRDVSLFMSYIRLSLYSLIGIVATIYYLFYNSRVRLPQKEIVFLWISLFWLVIYSIKVFHNVTVR